MTWLAIAVGFLLGLLLGCYIGAGWVRALAADTALREWFQGRTETVGDDGYNISHTVRIDWPLDA